MTEAGQKAPGIGRTFGIVALLTVLSKFAGLARDIVVAGAYGTSVLSDAYNYAYMLTGNILILFGGLGGPFHSATVTVLTPRKDDPNSGRLMMQVLLVTFLILGLVAIVVGCAAPYLVRALWGDYKHDADLFFRETTFQIQVMSPLIVIAGLIGVTYGILNVFNKVFWPSLSPAIASAAIIIAVVASADRTSSVPLAIGTLIGALGQLAAQIPGMVSTPLKFALPLKPEPELRNYTDMLWPAFISTSIGQLTVYVDSFFASGLQRDGAWTAIVNSNRLVQLPLGILLTAMLVPMLPRFTELIAKERLDDMKTELARSLRFLWFLSLPMMAIFFAIPAPIIEALFQRGAWTQESTNMTTLALVFLVPSIFFYVARDLLTRVFYAFQDSKTPYYVAMMAIVVKAALDYYFIRVLNLGVEGISLATTLVTVFNLTMLSLLLRKKAGNLGATRLIQPVLLMIMGSALCFGSTLGSAMALNTVLPEGTVGRLLLVVVASGVGFAAYLIFCIATRLDEPTMLVGRVPALARLPLLNRLLAKPSNRQEK